MLDYAANGTSYWKMDRLRQAAAETIRKKGKSLDDEILKLLDSDDPSRIDEYWKLVEENLRSNKVRLIFVADAIPSELRRLVEFLNEQMTTVEVLAVKVKQFVGEGQKAIVPRLLGMTEAAREVKQKSNRTPTNRQELLSKCPQEVSEFYGNILDSADKQGHTIYWGTLGFSIRVYLPGMENVASIAYGYPPNIFQIYFGHLPFPDNQLTELRKEILQYKIFKEAPKTLTVNLKKDNIQQAQEAYNLMEQRVSASASK
jgi:hypothetical protein